MGLFSWLFRKKQPKKLKIGLALGSGGAKGFAELGAVKALEENGVEFDCFAGTSIGSIIGAFLANGYSSTDILELLKGVNFSEIKNALMINMDTAGMFSVIDKTIGSLNIEELKKPFKCVATDADSAEEYVFESGSVALALSASSAYPPFFKPVVIENRRFVDGAFSNSVPADLTREMGADFVIGIDLSSHNPDKSFLMKIIPTFKGKVEKPWQKGYDNSNIMLHPNLLEYKPISFGAWHEIYDIGYQLAIEKMPEILQGIQQAKKELNKKTKK